MNLRDLKKVLLLTDERTKIERQIRLYEGLPGGEYWFIQFDHGNHASPNTRHPISTKVVADYLYKALADNTAALADLGVTAD